MENQCVGLAERLGLKPVVKRVKLRTPWRQTTPYLRLFHEYAFAPQSDALEPPWPDLLIATGRLSIAASLYLHHESRKGGARGTFTVQLQNPVIAPSHFDLVVAPRHDDLKGANVIATRGALHRVTRRMLELGASAFAPHIAYLPRPYIGVALGGGNAAYSLAPEDMRGLGEKLVQAACATKGSLVITPSRRTSDEALQVLRTMLKDVPHYLWDGKGDNPYFGILGTADFLIPTSDSINMVSEAAATGKPVYVAHLPGGSEKFHRFHRALEQDGVTRRFEGALDAYSYVPLDDLGRVAEIVETKLSERSSSWVSPNI